MVKEKTLIALDKQLKIDAMLKAKSEGRSLTNVVEHLLASWCDFKLSLKSKKKYAPLKTEHHQLICETVDRLKEMGAKHIELERWVSDNSRVDILCRIGEMKVAAECYTRISKTIVRKRYEKIAPYVDNLIFVVTTRVDEVKVHKVLGFLEEDFEVWKIWLHEPFYQYNFPTPEELMGQ